MGVVVAPHSGAQRNEYMMSSTATRFLAQIRRNVESWRVGEIDYVTFIESQRDTWAGIHTAGKHVEAEVLRALSGATSVTDLLLLGETQQRTVQLRVRRTVTLRPVRRYCALIARTAAGGPVLRVLAADPRSQEAEPRQVAAMIYEIAADMERRSQQLEVHWTIAADPENGQVVIELTGEHEAELADELVANVMTERQLI
jgi:hypothetical protein